jgi:hypothetical protein
MRPAVLADLYAVKCNEGTEWLNASRVDPLGFFQCQGDQQTFRRLPYHSWADAGAVWTMLRMSVAIAAERP